MQTCHTKPIKLSERRRLSASVQVKKNFRYYQKKNKNEKQQRSCDYNVIGVADDCYRPGAYEKNNVLLTTARNLFCYDNRCHLEHERHLCICAVEFR